MQVDKPQKGANVLGSYMKIAYITLLSFILFVAYGTLTSHTRAIQSIHLDNQRMVNVLNEINLNTGRLAHAIDRVPVPIPVSKLPSTTPQVANKNEIPIRRAEVVQ